MMTFTDMKRTAAELCGVAETSRTMTTITNNINIGIKRFQHQARRYYTNREKKTNIVAGQQFYQFPADMLRISNVAAVIDGQKYPLLQIRSEDEWNRLNLVKTFATNIPQYFFVKNRNELGIYPLPSQDVSGGLEVSYEPRIPDLSIEDTEIKVDVESNTVLVTRVTQQGNPEFKPTMENSCYAQLNSTTGNDGNWYKIQEVVDASNLKLENVFQGFTESGATMRIGQCPEFPEEYHIAPVYYAAQQYFLIRKDNDTARYYGDLFEQALREYQQVYGVKTTGGVLNAERIRVPNIFNVPPIGLMEG